jgi:iron complex outermembrane receptor protein
MKNYIVKLTVLGILLLGGNFSYSQILKGVVLDVDTKKAIQNAYVYSTDIELGSMTNNVGEFEISKFPKFNSKLLISALGYEEQVLFVTSDSLITILLKPQHEILDEVIVSTPTGKLQSENITYITKIKLNGTNSIKSNTIGEVLANVPGVYVASIGRGISKPVIRGLSGNRVVTYVDGLRIENQQWGGDHGIGVTSLGIDRLEVIKGPSSLLYGSDAIGGVLYFVETQYVPKNSWKSFIQTGFESISLSNTTNLGTQFTKGNSKFNMFYGSSINADYALPSGVRILDSRFMSHAFKGSYGFNKNNWKLNVRYNFSKSIIGIPGHSHKDSVYAELFYTDKVTWRSTLPKQDITNNFINVENKFYFKKSYLLIQTGHTINNLKEFEEKNTIPGIDMTLNSTTMNVRYAHKFSPRLEWITGAQGMYQLNSNGAKAEEILIPNAITSDLGVYSIFYVGNKKFKLQTGVRADYRQINVNSINLLKDFTGLNYAIGGGYFGDKSILRLNVSSGFRAPHTSEMLANGVHHGSFQYVIGNVNLKTENANQIDLTYEYNSEHVSLILNPYYNQIQNFIYLQKQDSLIENYPLYNYVQNEKVNLYGVDFGVHFHPHALHRLHLETSFSYIRAQNSAGEFIDQIPPAKWLTNVKVEFDEKEKFYIKNVIVRNNLIFAQSEVAPNETSSQMYNLLSIGFNGVLKTEKNIININAGVKNLLNSNYIDHLSNLKYLNIGAPGINFYLGAKFNINHKKREK